ncbi:hypothetical protein B9Z19DRAFT_1097370 [Tuber borchii]|uniref:Uncharacterized protein n=1 Tax=Tuber borchii TaxID=42251 RepID=A0A2T6ZA73_TUBBO|nr:hypothetical protein B9Z19DRAFT_1097370 [Tuber borchii]
MLGVRREFKITVDYVNSFFFPRILHFLYNILYVRFPSLFLFHSHRSCPFPFQLGAINPYSSFSHYFVAPGGTE